ncbi:Titin [Lucilia cuprina]|nr:Titin [Lucilia cuprina]
MQRFPHRPSTLETRVICRQCSCIRMGYTRVDGGAPLLGYHIAIRDMKEEHSTRRTSSEMSSCNTSSWLADHHNGCGYHSYARGKLLRRDEYFFRIWAKMQKKKRIQNNS